MKRGGLVRVGRRDLVRGGGGAAALAAALNALFGVAGACAGATDPCLRSGGRSRRRSGACPQLSDRRRPKLQADNVQVERFGWPLSDAPPDKALLGEFGLSMHVESRKGDQTRNVLVDFGFTSNALNNYLELLGVDPAALDALVLSRGDYDHFGGIVGFLRAAEGKLKPGTPFVGGGEECFCARQWTAPPVPGNFGALDRSAIEAARLTVVSAEQPTLITDHALTTGQAPAVTFEKILSPCKMAVGVSAGFGCYPEKLPEDERQAVTIPDKFRHEIATVCNLTGRGLAVLTSCSHRGVVNVVRRAQAASGVACR